MGIQYLISDFSTNMLQIDTQFLAQRLQNDWSPIDIRDETILSLDALKWDCHGITGGVPKDKSLVDLSGDLQTIAKFAVWFRHEVAIEIPLAILQTSYERGQLDLDENTTVQEVIDFFS